MKKTILSIVFLAISFTVFSKDVKNDFKVIATQGTRIRTSVADPCLLYEKGEFYITMTGASKLVLVNDRDLACLTTAIHPTVDNIFYDSQYDPSVKEMFGENATISGTWSPEIHYISEEHCPGNSGYYLFFALRQKLDNSRNIRTVIMKSKNGKIEGPYVHPVTNDINSSQPLLDKDGKPVDSWTIGMSLLIIPSGKYKGLYGTYVDEVGRGCGIKGGFYQRLRIAKLRSPWQLDSDLCTITSPTQPWEHKGSSTKYPAVVEGGTAVYGDHGEIFLVYCGSGYWSDYGLGQLTLKMENGDYCDPMKEESWIKYENNPVFTSRESDEIRGAGHAFFLKDDAGNRFFTYHAYEWDPVAKKKAKSRHAYIEPYRIDYSQKSETAPYGLLIFGANADGKAAPTETSVLFLKKKK